MNETLIISPTPYNIFEIDFTKYTPSSCSEFCKTIPYYINDNFTKLDKATTHENNSKLWKYGWSSSATSNYLLELSAKNLKKVSVTMFIAGNSQFSFTVMLNRNLINKLIYCYCPQNSTHYAYSYYATTGSSGSQIDSNYSEKINISAGTNKFVTLTCDLTQPGWKDVEKNTVDIYNWIGWRESAYANDGYLNKIQLFYE